MLTHNKFLYLIVFCFSLLSNITAQSVFNKFYNEQSGGIPSVRDMISTKDGGYITVSIKGTAGLPSSFGAGGNDIYVVKIDSQGSINWSRSYGGPNNDDANGIVQSLTGNFYITGHTRSFGTGIEDDIFILKIDSKGDIIWFKLFRGTQNDAGTAILTTPDSGCIAIGRTASYSSGQDIFAVKMLKNGTVDWFKVYRGTGQQDDEAWDILSTNDGGYLMSGRSSDNGDFESLLLKIASNGNIVWAKLLSDFGGSTENISSLTETSDGGYLLGGNTNNFGGTRGLLIKTDDTGAVEWAKAYLGTPTNYFSKINSIVENDKREIAFTGNTINFTSLLYGNPLVIVDSTGKTVSARGFGGDGNLGDYGIEILKNKKNGYIILGKSLQISPFPSFGIGLYSTDANGNIGCNQDTSLNAQDASFSLTTTPITFTDTNIVYIDSAILTVTIGCAYTNHFCSQTPNFNFTNAGNNTGFSDSTICLGDTVEFINTTLNANKAISWLWNFGDTASGTADTSSLMNPIHYFATIDTFQVMLIVNFKCQSDTFIRDIIIIPNAFVSIGNDAYICPDDSIIIGTIDSGFIEYIWSPLDSGQYISVNFPGEYILTTIDSNQCIAKDSLMLFNYNNPIINLGSDTAICKGDSLFLNINQTYTSLIWSTGDTSNSIFADTISNYSVALTDINGCKGVDTLSLTFRAPPAATSISDTFICSGDALQLFASGGTGYFWTPNDFLSNVNISDPIVIPTSDITYTIIVSDICKQTDTTFLAISVLACDIFVPNVFSPNNDGENDIFNIIGDGIKKIKIEIYDRWGDKVFISNSISFGWNGSINDEKANEGVYVYRITGNFLSNKPIELKGNLTLIR